MDGMRMGTQYFAGLYFEYNCDQCDGSGKIILILPDNVGSPVETPCLCKGTGKLCLRWHYTHAVTYEEALDKLLPRLSQWGSFPDDGKWILVWKRRGKVFLVTNVTPAVKYRINKIMENRRKRLLRTSVKL